LIIQCRKHWDQFAFWLFHFSFYLSSIHLSQSILKENHFFTTCVYEWCKCERSPNKNQVHKRFFFQNKSNLFFSKNTPTFCCYVLLQKAISSREKENWQESKNCAPFKALYTMSIQTENLFIYFLSIYTNYKNNDLIFLKSFHFLHSIFSSQVDGGNRDVINI